jgi:hypothetical protein
MEKDLQDGGNTEKHPLEIVPFLGGGVPSQGVEAFDIMTTIVASVVTSGYLICLWVIEKGFFNGLLDDAAKVKLMTLADRVVRVMHINAVYEPVQDLRDAAFKSNKGKIEAAKRPTPTILSFAFSYVRVATDILQQKKIRKTREELIMEQVNQHNSREKVRSSKTTMEEIITVNNVLQMSNWFQRRLKIIYQSKIPADTSMPTTLLASKLLNPSTEPSVKKEENPTWHNIEVWSQDKADAWLARTDGRFKFKVQETISKGKKPNLTNPVWELLRHQQ